jgi:hypothetical protein
VNLQHLDEILERATSRSHTQGLAVNKVMNTLSDEEVYQRPTHWSWIIGIAIVFLGFGILWLVWFKLTN